MKFKLIFTLFALLFVSCNEPIEQQSESIIENYENYEIIDDRLINLSKLDIGTTLNNPWALEFINDNEILVTEKNGNLIYANLETNKNHKVIHEIPVAIIGQGGLLDIKLYDDYLYVSFSIKNDDDKYTTAIGKGKLSDDFKKLDNFTILFKAEPFYSSGKHFGSRIIIKDNYLFDEREVEAFTYQLDYQEEQEGNVEEYLEHLFDFHDLDKKEKDEVLDDLTVKLDNKDEVKDNILNDD